MNGLMIFENTEVEIILNEQGEPLFEIYSTGMALGYSRTDGKTYITIENTESDHDVQKVKLIKMGELKLLELYQL